MQPVVCMANLIEAPLLKKDLEDQNQRFHGWQSVHEIAHKACSYWTVCHIKADVKVDAALHLHKFDNGHLGIGNYLKACKKYTVTQTDDTYGHTNRQLNRCASHLAGTLSDLA